MSTAPGVLQLHDPDSHQFEAVSQRIPVPGKIQAPAITKMGGKWGEMEGKWGGKGNRPKTALWGENGGKILGGNRGQGGGKPEH